MSFHYRLVFRFLLTILLVWLLDYYYGAHFIVEGGWFAIIAMAAIITLLNTIVRPVLELITLPLKFFAHILAFVVVNGLIVWMLVSISDHLDSSAVSLNILGGFLEWTFIAVVLGFSNWIMKEILKKRGNNN
jgi:putative membrane protein